MDRTITKLTAHQKQEQTNQTPTKPAKYFVQKSLDDDGPEYYYTNYKYPQIVWTNIYLFAILHLIYFYGLYYAIFYATWTTWMFMYAWSVLGGLGITAGAHRLWSHKSYKATYSLRFFLMICNCIAGQNDLIEWCRDHRLHHKFSETDADPHDSNRGWFFAHIGWLLQKKHPKVLERGKKLDLTDLQTDPVLIFQRRHYLPLAVSFGLLIPSGICCLFCGEPLSMSLMLGIWRYVHSLNCTWFVNSAAHIWGTQDYDKSISPRESVFVAAGALGEGFHNYHHTFPYDYSTSEHGGYFNFTTTFIDLMSALGLAYDLKYVDKKIVSTRRVRTGDTPKQSSVIKRQINHIVRYNV